MLLPLGPKADARDRETCHPSVQSSSDHEARAVADPGPPEPAGGDTLTAPLPMGGVRSVSGRASWPHLLRKVLSPTLWAVGSLPGDNVCEEYPPSLPGK